MSRLQLVELIGTFGHRISSLLLFLKFEGNTPLDFQTCRRSVDKAAVCAHAKFRKRPINFESAELIAQKMYTNGLLTTVLPQNTFYCANHNNTQAGETRFELGPFCWMSTDLSVILTQKRLVSLETKCVSNTFKTTKKMIENLYKWFRTRNYHHQAPKIADHVFSCIESKRITTVFESEFCF